MMYTITVIRGLLPVVPYLGKDMDNMIANTLEDTWMATLIMDHEEWISEIPDQSSTTGE